MSALPVLILGAASDIGRALARTYGAAGRPLILAARQHERLEPDAVDLRLRHGVPVTVVSLEITDAESRRQLVEGLGEPPGTVISVVGLLGDQASASADPVRALEVMMTNYTGPALMLEALAAGMAARGTGTIVGISSVAGDRGRASNYTYGSAKAGFTAYLSGLRNRLARTGVRVITVKPGFVATRMIEGMKLPKPLVAQPAEVADAILSAETRRRDVIYVRPVWRVVMLVIRLLPEPLFKRMTL